MINLGRNGKQFLERNLVMYFTQVELSDIVSRTGIVSHREPTVPLFSVWLNGSIVFVPGFFLVSPRKKFEVVGHIGSLVDLGDDKYTFVPSTDRQAIEFAGLGAIIEEAESWAANDGKQVNYVPAMKAQDFVDGKSA